MTTRAPNDNPFGHLINLAHPRLGAKAVYTTDEWFAPCERMLQPEPPVFIPDKFDDNGKWMDGWETRRKRGEGFDHAVVRLGRPGFIRGVDIDTTHFTGNYPPAASVWASDQADEPGDDSWQEIVPATDLEPRTPIPRGVTRALSRCKLN